jgi:hypothetical protein
MAVKSVQFEVDVLRQEWGSILEEFMRQTADAVLVVCACFISVWSFTSFFLHRSRFPREHR